MSQELEERKQTAYDLFMTLADLEVRKGHGVITEHTLGFAWGLEAAGLQNSDAYEAALLLWYADVNHKLEKTQ